MSYCVHRTMTNGYRCSCCRRDYEDTDWVDDKDAALDIVRKGESRGDSDLVRVEVVDGATGEVIAWGELEWLGGRRHSYGFAERWHGQIEGAPFERIERALPGETWAQVNARYSAMLASERVQKAEAELAAAQKELDAAREAAEKAKP